MMKVSETIDSFWRQGKEHQHMRNQSPQSRHCGYVVVFGGGGDRVVTACTPANLAVISGGSSNPSQIIHWTT